MKSKLCILLSVLVMMLGSCGDDESWAPAYITDFADLRTDGNGVVVSMTLDDGREYVDVQLRDDFDGEADTVYRAICVYTLQNSEATLHSVTPAFAPQPIVDDGKLEIKTDPCIIQSIWRGGDYINARMLVQGKDLPHIAAFIDLGIAANAEGTAKVLTLQLYHDSNGDAEAFTRTIYLSCPLRGYEDSLTRGRDSLAFVVNQANKGMTTYMFAY